MQNSKITEVSAKLRLVANEQLRKTGEPMRVAMQENLKQIGVDKVDTVSMLTIQQKFKDLDEGKLKVKG